MTKKVSPIDPDINLINLELFFYYWDYLRLSLTKIIVKQSVSSLIAK